MRKLLMIPVAALVTAACATGSANQTEQQAQLRDQQQLIRAQPVPGYNYSQIRQNLIEIENSQAQGVQTTSFFFNQGVRDPIKSCPSIGAPIPTTTQLTNPLQTVGAPHSQSGVVDQMDPNGVYTGDSTGTYVMCVNPEGRAYASYWEGFVETEYGAAQWDYNTHSVRLVGQPTYRFSGGK